MYVYEGTICRLQLYIIKLELCDCSTDFSFELYSFVFNYHLALEIVIEGKSSFFIDLECWDTF